VSFNHTYKYIDDILSMNNNNFHNYVQLMYHDKLEIMDTTESKISVSYWYLDDLNFAIVNFPFLRSNISAVLRTLIKIGRAVGKNTLVHFMSYDVTM
jgi:hypothetical protein